MSELVDTRFNRRNPVSLLQERLAMRFGYLPFVRRRIGGKSEYQHYLENHRPITGYPSNHDFYLYKNALVPGYRLFKRYYKIHRCYPQNMDSLLDISTCRGFYVLDASQNYGVSDAVGMDLEKEFIDTANDLKEKLGDVSCQFSTAPLESFHDECLNRQRQFDVTICIGSYHYFFWGSAQNDLGYFDHDRILQMMADLTRKRVIFSGRLDYDRLSHYPRQVAKDHPALENYNTETFLKCASRYFNIQDRGDLGNSTLYVLDKR